MALPEGITGYWPYLPHKCVVCGVVTYVDGRKLEATVEPYDSTQDTLDHIEKVRARIFQVNAELVMRGAIHDQSKLQSPEKEAHDRVNPRLRSAEFGSDAYKAALADMGEAVQHHYSHNRHHPEYHPDGINGMNLVDAIEMLCDWKAATERSGGDLAKSIEINAQRFGIGKQLKTMLLNTASDFGWLTVELK